ncbi:MAG: DUF4124 domain-containing protein, partial [Candidatus Thiodiazotropha endolucinida]
MGTCVSLVLAVANTFPAGGEVYRWTDDNGKLHFSDRRPENAKATSVEMPSTQKKKGIS